MSTSDIDQMLAEKGNLCISIVIPTRRFSRDRIQNPKVLQKAVLKAKSLIQHGAWPHDKILQIEKKIDAVLERIDYMRLEEGLAIFVSPNISKLMLLPFLVKEKVIIGKTFELRDLFYYAQFLKTYYLLALTKKRIRLFKGEGRDIQEIHNDDFPKKYVEEYEYQKPTSIGSSASSGLQNFEHDKSAMQEIRQKSFIKQADKSIDKYLKNDTSLLVAGVEEELANFESVTHHLPHVVGKIGGSYDYDAIHPLSEVAWKKMNEFINALQEETLLKLKEDIGKQLAVDGIREVWKMAKEGNCKTLLVEKDYQSMAYVNSENDTKIYLTPPTGNYEIIMDVIDDVMEIVKEKGGNIMIVENGKLKEFDHIAMLLRYVG